jgi:hypothetical protein
MLRCQKCGNIIPEKAMREEMARLMIKRRPKKILSHAQAQAMGKLSAQKRWGKSSK